MATNKKPGYNKNPKKIFIVVNCDRATSDFCTGVIKGLQDNFIQKGIQSDSHIHDSLSLENDKDLSTKIASYNPEATLIIQQIISGYGKDTFELTLVDSDTKKNVWKGEFDLDVNTYYASSGDRSIINKSVKAILQKLMDDKII